MEIPNNYYRISIKALVLNEEGKFLLVKEAKGVWELPGGGLDFGETTEECIKREIKEEMNLEVTHIEKAPSYFFTFKYHGIWKSNLCFFATLKNLYFTPSDECVEIRFFNTQEVLDDRENMLPNVLEFVKQIQQ